MVRDLKGFVCHQIDFTVGKLGQQLDVGCPAKSFDDVQALTAIGMFEANQVSLSWFGPGWTKPEGKVLGPDVGQKVQSFGVVGVDRPLGKLLAHLADMSQGRAGLPVNGMVALAFLAYLKSKCQCGNYRMSKPDQCPCNHKPGLHSTGDLAFQI